jgi:hypothetical protein
VLIRKIGQDGKTDVVLGKALCLLPETELLKPVSDLLHRGLSFGDFLGINLLSSE